MIGNNIILWKGCYMENFNAVIGWGGGYQKFKFWGEGNEMLFSSETLLAIIKWNNPNENKYDRLRV